MGKDKKTQDSIKNIEVQTDLYKVDLFFICLITPIVVLIIDRLFKLIQLGSYLLKIERISKINMK